MNRFFSLYFSFNSSTPITLLVSLCHFSFLYLCENNQDTQYNISQLKWRMPTWNTILWTLWEKEHGGGVGGLSEPILSKIKINIKIKKKKNGEWYKELHTLLHGYFVTHILFIFAFYRANNVFVQFFFFSCFYFLLSFFLFMCLIFFFRSMLSLIPKESHKTKNGRGG